jgi:hypothetical protein
MRMKRLGILLVFLIAAGHMQAQRLSLGFNLQTTAFHNTTLADPYIFPKSSYFIYYSGNNKKDGKPIHNQYLNGFATGINVNIDYKRFMFTTEWLVASTRLKIPVYYPSSLGSSLDEDHFDMTVSQGSISLGLIGLVKLTTKANGPFATAGFEFSKNQFTEIHDDNYPFLMTLYATKKEMYGTLYNEESLYKKAIVGIGVKKNDRYVSLRYSQRILASASELPTARMYQLDLVWAKMLNFQKLRKGYKIYLE